MQFRILGRLEVLGDGRQVALGGDKQRAVVALLLIYANRPVSSEKLIDELWGEQPPASAAKTLQVHISRVRKALGQPAGRRGDGVLLTRERGYELRVDLDSVDALRFERLVDEARGEMAAAVSTARRRYWGGAVVVAGTPLAEFAQNSARSSATLTIATRETHSFPSAQPLTSAWSP